METVIALDIGKARIGIAQSDPMGIVVRPLKTIKAEELITELKQLTEIYIIPKIIVGIPINPQEGNKDAENLVKSSINQIKAAFPNLEIILENECFTSAEAKERLQAEGIKLNKDNKHLIDMYSAAIILEQYWRGSPQ